MDPALIAVLALIGLVLYFKSKAGASSGSSGAPASSGGGGAVITPYGNITPGATSPVAATSPNTVTQPVPSGSTGLLPTGSGNGGQTQTPGDYPTQLPTGEIAPSQAQINQALNLIGLGDPSVARAFLNDPRIVLTDTQRAALISALTGAGYPLV